MKGKSKAKRARDNKQKINKEDNHINIEADDLKKKAKRKRHLKKKPKS